MKVFLLCLILLAVVELSFARKKCQKQSDCDEDECCLDNFFFESPHCEKRHKAEEKCYPVAIYKPGTDHYYLTCPCVPLYECLGVTTTNNGVTVIKDAKCVIPK